MSEEQCVVAELEDAQQWRTAMEVLYKSHFRNDEISTVTSGDQLTAELPAVCEEEVEESPPTGSSLGVSTAVGTALGGYLGMMTIMGPLLIAGPLAGMAAGAAAGGVLASIRRWGLGEDAKADYQESLEAGHILLIVHGDNRRVEFAHKLLHTVGPLSLHCFEG